MTRTGMQTPGEKEKFDRLTAIVGELTRIANGLGLRYKVAGDPYAMEGRADTYQVKKHQGAWSVVWAAEGTEKALEECSLAVKRLFLQHAAKFFGDYIAMAKEWEGTVDRDLEAGERALSEVRKAVGEAER